MKNEEKMKLVENSICAFEMKYSAPVPMPCEPVLPWKAPVKKKMAECCNQEKEDTMNYNEIEASRKYLNQRASETFYKKEQDLSDQFNIRKPERPQTYKDLIDAIKNGNYELDTKKTARIDGYVEEEGYYFGSMLDGIVWKLPDGPDRDGFDAAYKVAKAALTAAKDVINTQDSSAGLKALQDFEAWTYTAPTTTTAQ